MSYLNVKVKNRKIFEMMSVEGLAIKHRKTLEKMNFKLVIGQETRPLQTFIYLLDIVVLRSIFIT